jgi:Phytanoyl-CoA dioxygenase (PhyH)
MISIRYFLPYKTKLSIMQTLSIPTAAIFKEPLLPTREEIMAYQQNGWLLTNLFIRDEILEKCRQAIEEIYTCNYDRTYAWSTDQGNPNFNEPYTDRSQRRMDAYVSMHKNTLRDVIQSDILGAYAAALMDSDLVRLYRDILLTIPPDKGDGTAGTGWHVDKNYWATCSSDKITSAWFSINDCDEENGCLVVANASHLWPRSRFVKKIRLDDTDRIRQFNAGGDAEIVPVRHQKGQVSFHSCLLLHATYPNTSDRTRQSFAVAFQDGDNHYQEVPGDRTKINFNTNDRVGPRSDDGAPDYHDPLFYPVVFPRN